MALAYVVITEHIVCTEQPKPCRWIYNCPADHPKAREWKLASSITPQIGTAHGHLARIAKKVASYVQAPGNDHTGEVKIVQVDLGALPSIWNEAEQAAYRIGGIEAVKRMQKGVAAEARENARVLARQLKEQERERLKAEKRAARKKTA